MIEGSCNLDWMKPNDVGQFQIKTVRETAKDFEWKLRQILEPGREASLALTKLEECVMWATKSICIETKE